MQLCADAVSGLLHTVRVLHKFELKHNALRCWQVRSTRCQKDTVHLPLEDRPSGKAPPVILVLKLTNGVFVTRVRSTHGHFHIDDHPSQDAPGVLLTTGVF